MTRGEYQEVDPGSVPYSESQQQFFETIRATTPPSGASVLSDKSGKYFHAFCSLCGWRGVAANDKDLIQGRADAHNEEKHGMRRGLVEVITRSVCARCGTAESVPGAEGETPPRYWAIAALSVRGGGGLGWTDSIRNEYVLCPRCARNARVYLETKEVAP